MLHIKIEDSGECMIAVSGEKKVIFADFATAIIKIGEQLNGTNKIAAKEFMRMVAMIGMTYDVTKPVDENFNDLSEMLQPKDGIKINFPEENKEV